MTNEQITATIATLTKMASAEPPTIVTSTCSDPRCTGCSCTNCSRTVRGGAR